MPSNVTDALLVPAGSNEVWWIDSRVDVKLTAEQTQGHAGMWIWTARRGAASPMHLHRREDEQFLVIDGEARFIVDGRQIEARAGDTVFLPREVPHAYLITSETARLVGTATPGGFESFFSDLGTPVVPGEPEARPPSIESMARTSADYGIELLGPPPRLD
jgi:quercetin dioxygenase-like cupin family protein